MVNSATQNVELCLWSGKDDVIADYGDYILTESSTSKKYFLWRKLPIIGADIYGSHQFIMVFKELNFDIVADTIRRSKMALGLTVKPEENIAPQPLTKAQLATAIIAVERLHRGRIHPLWFYRFGMFFLSSILLGFCIALTRLQFVGVQANVDDWYFIFAWTSGLSGIASFIFAIVLSCCTTRQLNHLEYREAVTNWWKVVRERYDSRLDADPTLFKDIADQIGSPIKWEWPK